MERQMNAEVSNDNREDCQRHWDCNLETHSANDSVTAFAARVEAQLGANLGASLMSHGWQTGSDLRFLRELAVAGHDS
jgi:hypothetical protein